MIVSFYNNKIDTLNKPRNNYQFTGAKFKMKEDFFATSRNGHPLIDTFDAITNSLDIYSTGLYPANVLSNLAHKEFHIDGVKCASLEGFLQSLKTKDISKQEEICQLYGGSARKVTKKLTEWLKTQKLYWRSKEYDRSSAEYLELLKRAYKSCYEQNLIFRNALDSTKGVTLTHSDGKLNKKETVITRDEFIKILTDLRDGKI